MQNIFKRTVDRCKTFLEEVLKDAKHLADSRCMSCIDVCIQNMCMALSRNRDN